MQLTLKRNFFQITGITFIALCSILIAFLVERMLLRYTALSSDVTKLIFSIVLPTVLLILNRILSLVLNANFIRGGITIMPSKLPQFDEITTKALSGIQTEISNYFHQQYNIDSYTLLIFDWKSRQYISIVRNKIVLPQNHALVYFSKQYHAVFCTERRSQIADTLPDAVQAEVVVFMSKHDFAFAVPLFTEQDVYGFIFLEQRAVINSRLYAMNDFSALEKFGRSIGPLLHQTIVYQAIVRAQ